MQERGRFMIILTIIIIKIMIFYLYLTLATIAAEVKTPLSTMQRRIRKMCKKQYIKRKNELNYKK